MFRLGYVALLFPNKNEGFSKKTQSKILKENGLPPKLQRFVWVASRQHGPQATLASTERTMRFRPCIDVHNGRVKQIVGSSLSADGSQAAVVNFEADKPAAYYANLYRQSDLPGGHVILLGGDRETSERAALQALAAYPQGLQVGGGITDDNAIKYLEAGASHVIVTSFVFRSGRLDEDRLLRLVRLIGKDRIVLDLSCRAILHEGKRHYYVYTDRWTQRSDMRISVETLEWLSRHCAEFLVHAVDVEGKQSGIDEELVHLLARDAPLPVTYAGGVRNLQDIERVLDIGRGHVDVTVGSALDIFGGQLPFELVVRWQRDLETGIAR
ncbi:Enzyme that catalyzes the fourth step in the histidine pathway [Cyanidiococcus yangmingshanensis]|uniref:1-(5-phosphoribosyl)-5-[(5-phosphoribosylamino)methylideneamino]imidazole-4-carboxamideisomerase n=1 Tax=Cyanidiococcus yangmingshanensis TaxID=2690220 RepID=A0A7J7IJD6_9RHOD|nr:Enzyme that catalyzes the fourth step in the histidine pathway [Cyanidiococcus yangmingshanensis]